MSQVPAPLFFMSHGPDGEAAQALAVACGVTDEVAAFEPMAMDRQLRTGQHCVLVWSDPQTTLAEALRLGLSPTSEAADWLGFANAVLQRVDRPSGTLVLVDAQMVRSGDHNALGRTLPLTHAPVLGPLARDTADLLAALLLPHLPDLQSLGQRLRQASLMSDLPADPLVDLDGLVDQARDLELAVQARDALKSRLNTGFAALPGAGPSVPDPVANAPQSAHLEVRLLRDQLAYLQSELGLGRAPAASRTAPAGIEAVTAKLLSDLVHETDRRILAERQVQSAHAALRRHGIDASALPMPSATGHRPQS